MFAGTIVASNYVKMARLLGDSFLRHHPTSRFAILVIDDGDVDIGIDIDGEFDDDATGGIELLRLADLDLPGAEIEMMKTIYDVMEFSTAVKPSLLRTLLRQDSVACYLDPDISVYAPFDDVVEVVGSSGIVLTPHVLQPVPRDGLAISEQAVMQSGMFNLGFIAVGPSAGPFLDWWMERLLTDAVSDLDQHLFTDQKWVDWVPSLFDHHITRDPGMNVAWWNIHERPVALEDGRPMLGDHPVRFIHYSGYDPQSPAVLSKHQVSIPRVEHSPGTAIRELADEYGRDLIERGHLEQRTSPYQWSTTPAGLRLTPTIRRLCRETVLANIGTPTTSTDQLLPTAFDSDGTQFLAWLNEPTNGTPEHPISRIEVSVWNSRSDLRTAFPDVNGSDAERFHMWLSVEDDAITHLGELAPPRKPRVAAPVASHRARALSGSAVSRGRHMISCGRRLLSGVRRRVAKLRGR